MDQLLVQHLHKTLMYYILLIKLNKWNPQTEKLWKKFEYFQLITIIATEVILIRMINGMTQVLLLGRMVYIFNMVVVILEYLQIVLLMSLKSL